MVPEGAELRPYRPYNYTPDYSYSNMKTGRGSETEQIRLGNTTHVFYPPPRPIFPTTTGIGRTNQPSIQEVPENLRYAAYSRPGDYPQADNRIIRARRATPQPELGESLRGTPVSEIPTDSRIKGKRWDPENKEFPQKGTVYRSSSRQYRRVTYPPVRTMPPLAEDETLDMDEADPNEAPQAEAWSPRSRRVVETHPYTYDRSEGGQRRVTGIARQGSRMQPFRHVDTLAEDIHRPPQPLPADPVPGPSGAGASSSSSASQPDAASGSSSSPAEPKKSSSLLDTFKNFFKKK